ncbi:MAG: universal stress protein [Chloroflexota bacterium]
MAQDNFSIARARQDFVRATRRGAMRRMWANLTGRNNDLIPFEELRKRLDTHVQLYRGLSPVPVAKIIGSLGRSNDFDRAFMPTQRHSRTKWVSVDSAYYEGVTLPPVSLYKVGEAYFVVDGHHRVSVARQQGQIFIDAEVIEVDSRVPVTADLTLDDLDRVQAYRKFLDETKLDRLRPDQDMQLTMPGDYVRILEHIRVHKYFVERDEGRGMSWEEAVTHWYDRVYQPVRDTIERRDLLADFPGHTVTDLYLWIIEHAYYLSREAGHTVAPWEAAQDYAKRFSRRPNRLFSRIRRRVLAWLLPSELEPGLPPGTWREERVESGEHEHLFRDILVTVTGAPTGWLALAQAAEIARREGSTLRGLHVAASAKESDQERGRQVLEEFRARCQSLGLATTSHLETGDIAAAIIERARWADLVVINQRRVHGQWAERPLGTIFHAVAAQVPCPILAVPGAKVMPLERVVLAYDGSPKAREALYIFRHMITCWKVAGVILTIEGDGSDRDTLDSAWQYVQKESGQVATRYESGAPADVIARVMGEEQANLLLIGGSGHQPLLKAFLGSMVDRVLRMGWFPVLICH